VWRLLELMRDHFGHDERGRRRILGFLPWHLDFFSRYRPLPEAEFLEASRRHPLIQTRFPLGEDLPPLERLLRDPRPETHERLAVALVDSASREEGLERALALADALSPIDSTASLSGPRDETLAAG
jgi:tRNA-dihydrouridine synthase 3